MLVIYSQNSPASFDQEDNSYKNNTSNNNDNNNTTQNPTTCKVIPSQKRQNTGAGTGFSVCCWREHSKVGQNSLKSTEPLCENTAGFVLKQTKPQEQPGWKKSQKSSVLYV